MENNNLPAVKQEEVIKKQNAWANYALEAHNSKESLTIRSNEAIIKATNLPTEIDKIAESEKTLKELKSEQKSLETDRKAITSKLDKFFDGMMLPEKQLLAVIPAYENSIIELKKRKKVVDDLVLNKQIELKSIRERFQIHINNSKQASENVIIDKVNKSYEYALTNAKDANTIGIKDKEDLTLDAYLTACKYSKKAVDFVIEQPKLNVVFADIKTLDEIWSELFNSDVNCDGKLYAAKLANEIDTKFKHFSIAIKDKERALEYSKKEAEKAKIALEDETQMQNVGAKLAANATVLQNEAPTTKELKLKYEIDMPDDQENAMRIMAAFFSNINKTASEVKCAWMKLSVEQMGKALAALKNKDNKFDVTGIVFKAVDKLK